jgi:hypothetical protein
MITAKKLFWIIAVQFLLCGCVSHHYVPNPYVYQISLDNDFSSTSSISFVNVQTSTEDILFAKNGPHKFFANLQRWTEAAIDLTRQELVKRGMKVEEHATKTLKLSIDSAKTKPDGSAVRCYTTLKAETGGGYARTYLGSSRIVGPFYGVFYLMADNSVTGAVAEMLKDPQIVNYLTK